ncbi:MAG: hypothetical protein ABI972_23280 [Acidobacteriota bacterium]
MEPASLVDGAAIASRFHRLMGSFISNNLNRTVFQRWEMELLIDIASCQMERRVTIRMFGEYRKAEHQRLATMGGPLMLLSEYLDRRQRRRKIDHAAKVPANGNGHQ